MAPVACAPPETSRARGIWWYDCAHDPRDEAPDRTHQRRAGGLAMSEARAALPWWEAELPRLAEALRAQLRWRMPRLAAHHDDLVNDTLLALSQRLRDGGVAVPPSWLLPGSVPEDG